MCNGERLQDTAATPMVQPYSERTFFLAWVLFPGLTPQGALRLGKSFKEAEGRLGEEWGRRVMPASLGTALRLEGKGLPDICTQACSQGKSGGDPVNVTSNGDRKCGQMLVYRCVCYSCSFFFTFVKPAL